MRIAAVMLMAGGLSTDKIAEALKLTRQEVLELLAKELPKESK